jgi:chromate transporter
MKDLFEIFWIFFRMSAVTFGGGYAMLPILQREIVDKRQWLTHERIVDYYAISQGLPGIIAVNVSIFIGKERKGVAGGIAGALGIVSPCLLIISLIAAFLGNFQDLPLVRHAFSGIAVCVAALILDAVLGLWKKAIVNVVGLVLFALAFVAMLVFKVSPVYLVLLSAVSGILVGHLKRKKQA